MRLDHPADLGLELHPLALELIDVLHHLDQLLVRALDDFLCLVFSLGKNELCFLLRAGFNVLRQPLRGEQGFLQRPLAIEMLLQPKLQMAELVAQRAIGLDQLFNFRGDRLEEAFYVRLSKPAERGLEPLLANIKGGNLHWLSIRKSRSKRPRAPNFCTAR